MSDGLKFLASVIDNGSVTALTDADADLFIDNEATTLEFVAAHVQRHGGLPTRETVRNELQIQLPTRYDLPGYHMERMARRRLYNEVRPRFGDLREALKENDTDDILDCIAQLHTLASRTTRSTRQVQTAAEVYAQTLEQYERDSATRGTELLGIPTGWEPLDLALGGWLSDDIVTFVARPSMGKTFLLIHIAYTAWVAGRSVLFVTTEMTPRQIGYRLMGYQAGINPRLIRIGQLSRYGERRLVNALTEVEHDTNFNMVSAAGEPVTYIEGLVQQYQPDLVVIDSFHLLKPTTGRRDAGRYERIGNVMDEINQMKLRIGRPIILSSHLNRDAGEEGVKGSLENISNSDTIGTHSSVVLNVKAWPAHGVCRIPYFNPRHARVIDPLKMRDGEADQFGILYRPPNNFTWIRSADFRKESERQQGTPEERAARTDYMIHGNDSEN